MLFNDIYLCVVNVTNMLQCSSDNHKRFLNNVINKKKFKDMNIVEVNDVCDVFKCDGINAMICYRICLDHFHKDIANMKLEDITYEESNTEIMQHILTQNAKNNDEEIDDICDDEIKLNIQDESMDIFKKKLTAFYRRNAAYRLERNDIDINKIANKYFHDQKLLNKRLYNLYGESLSSKHKYFRKYPLW